MIHLYKIVFFIGLLKISNQHDLPVDTVESFESNPADLAKNADQNKNSKRALNNELRQESALYLLSKLISKRNLNEIQKVALQAINKNRIAEGNAQINDKNQAVRRNLQDETLQLDYAEIEQNGRRKKVYKRDSYLSLFSLIPVRFLMPIMQIGKGVKDTASGTKTVLGGVQNITGGMFRMAQEVMKTTNGLTTLGAENLNIIDSENTKSDNSNENNNIGNVNEKSNS